MSAWKASPRSEANRFLVEKGGSTPSKYKSMLCFIIYANWGIKETNCTFEHLRNSSVKCQTCRFCFNQAGSKSWYCFVTRGKMLRYCIWEAVMKPSLSNGGLPGVPSYISWSKNTEQDFSYLYLRTTHQLNKLKNKWLEKTDPKRIMADWIFKESKELEKTLSPWSSTISVGDRFWKKKWILWNVLLNVRGF